MRSPKYLVNQRSPPTRRFFIEVKVDFQINSLGPTEVEDGQKGSRFLRYAILSALGEPALLSFRRLGLRSVLLHLYSCYRRIALEKTLRLDRVGLEIEWVRRSFPKRATFPRNCSVARAYILSIQAQERVRPYLRPSDLEPLAQAWFQVERCFARNADTELCTEQPLDRTPWAWLSCLSEPSNLSTDTSLMY